MYNDVLLFWFEETEPKMWWVADPDFDRLIKIEGQTQVPSQPVTTAQRNQAQRHAGIDQGRSHFVHGPISADRYNPLESFLNCGESQFPGVQVTAGR